MTYPKQLVLRVNEIYHDVEEAEYQNLHPEIFQHEAERWERVGRRFLADHERPLRLLDIGSGTGFVPLQLGPYLRAGDVLSCSDLSGKMLAVCEGNVEARGFACRREYLKLDGQRLPVEDESCDLVTMNSVLHHVPEFGPFLGEIDRVLKRGGRLVIGHEPNQRFYQHPLLWHHSRVVGALLHPRQEVGSVLRKLGLIDLARKVLRRFSSNVAAQNQTVQAVNQQLLSEGLIERPLTQDQITRIVDFHSPTAGGIHRERGIDIESIRGQYLPQYELELLETYNHLGDGGTKSAWVRRYERFLQGRFPQGGATLLAVLRKARQT